MGSEMCIRDSDVQQPTTMPAKFEAGNLNAPAIAGLAAGLKFLKTEQAHAGQENFQRCSELLLQGLRTIDGLTLNLPKSINHRIGIFSISVDGLDPHEVANLLDLTGQVQVRSGLHCAPLLHQQMGTFDQGGTVRLSVGVFTTPTQVEQAVEVLREVSQPLV